jgi:hypothetical protein
MPAAEKKIFLIILKMRLMVCVNKKIHILFDYLNTHSFSHLDEINKKTRYHTRGWL